jgi:hypothetical protein
MTDRILALVAIIVLTGFLAILIWRVPRLDLAGVIAITLALAYWDFITSAGRKPQQR